VTDTSRSVVGREAELSAVHSFVLSIFQGAAALALEGDAGAGKTTLWTAGIEDANNREFLILEVRPAERETGLSFSGIGDLLDPVLDEALGPLPPAQRNALSRALVLVDDDVPPPDPRSVGVALLNALRGLADKRPLLVAVDDVQWLDEDSAGALLFAARRLREEHVGVLICCRTPVESALLDELRRSLSRDRFYEVVVGPLAAGAIHHVIRTQLGIALPRPVVAEVHAAAGGNPFYVLEIVRMLQRTEASVEPGQPLPVPESLRELIHGRLLALPQESRDYLLAAAALSQPTLNLIEAVTGVGREAGLVPALDARIVELEGNRIRFTHPLLAASVYQAADPVRRAGVHARLAELVDDPEAKGRHLAASVERPDESVAAALEEAAHRARARGARHAAAVLLDRAHELTPDGQLTDALRRGTEAAYMHFEAGDALRAEAQLHEMLVRLSPGRPRARALLRLARVRSYRAQAEAAELFLQAVDEAEGDPEMLAVAHEGVANCFLRLHERLDESVEHAKLAAGLAVELGDAVLAGEALGTQLLSETLLGRLAAAETEGQVLAFQDAADQSRVLRQPLPNVAARWRWTDELVPARTALLESLERARALGDESSRPLLLMFLGEVESTLGELASALGRAREGQELSEQAGELTLFANHLALESLVESQRGREETARRTGLRALELAPSTGARHAELLATRALTHLELVHGAPESALAWSEPYLAFVQRQAIVEPGATPFVLDRVEALIELDRRNEAIELLDWHESNAERLERSSALASCRRCRGLLAAQQGELDAALVAYQEALARHAEVEVPLERGRTLQALGVTQRRMKHRREARETLEEALAVFQRIDSALWAEGTRFELRRISGRAANAGDLTPAEGRVANLVAEGKTNQEIAAALFLSKRTIEGHLSRIYTKLRVRSRSELTRELLSGAEPRGTVSKHR
jgi:DNA-binding CsgD family transcriptional regulator